MRELPPDEWGRLRAIEEGFVPPVGGRVLVIEDENGEIVGRWIAMTVCVVEGFWIAPAHRRRHWRLALRLLDGMKALLRAAGVRTAFAFANDPQIADYMTRQGFVARPDLLSFLFEVE